MKLYTKASVNTQVSTREKENRKIAYNAALEGIVLLENDGTLPLPSQKIALYGSGAEYTIKGGTGSGEVNERYSVTIKEGLTNAGFEISTTQWIEDYRSAFDEAELEYAETIRKLLRKLDLIAFVSPSPFRYPIGRAITDEDIKNSDTDTCIYIVSRQSGECSDREIDKNDYSLTDIEIENIKKLANTYKKTIIVLNVGASMDINVLQSIKGINAIVHFCQQGSEGGNALADILTGKVTPSGHLTDTWGKRYEDIPFANEYSIISGQDDIAEYKEDIYVGYRYFDSFKVDPLYPFGYGLSYVSFTFDKTTVEVKKTQVTVSTSVTNTDAKMSGKAVAQLYLSFPQKKVIREFQSLVAFAKTNNLKPGETQELSLSFNLEDVGSYDEQNACFILEEGDYTLRLGENSRDTKICSLLSLPNDVILSRHQNVCPVQKTFETLVCPQAEETITGIDILPINPNDFTTKDFDYKKPEISLNETGKKILDSLTPEDMVELAVGIGGFGGETYITVPGAGGYTTSTLLDKGLANIVFADGPAGLRLTKTAAITKKEKVKMVDARIQVMNYLPKWFKKLLFADPKKNKLIYQFTTAFPVGNALSQSWNIDLMESIGSAIGREMERYGVTVWLAPALNIHRNPLCGRNFEYFSEDPLLSGKIAAAITRGVQSHEGCFVSIKHFACNNQETNRQKMSSNVTERALREIYLKGFEIAVKESSPKTVMTSYNKLNGIYTPNNYDLCTNVLRNEWGFDGLVMTDWWATYEKKELANNALAFASGNDLIMPGGKSYKKIVLKALRSGDLSIEDLKWCCANIINVILESKLQKEWEERK